MCPVDMIVVDSLDFFDLRAACSSAVCRVLAMVVGPNSQELQADAADALAVALCHGHTFATGARAGVPPALIGARRARARRRWR